MLNLMKFQKKGAKRDAVIQSSEVAMKTLKMETINGLKTFRTAPDELKGTFPLSGQSGIQQYEGMDYSSTPCLSPIGSDSEEESGYVSCASNEKKRSRESLDIDKITATVNNSLTSESINDLSLSEQGDVWEMNKSISHIDVSGDSNFDGSGNESDDNSVHGQNSETKTMISDKSGDQTNDEVPNVTELNGNQYESSEESDGSEDDDDEEDVTEKESCRSEDKRTPKVQFLREISHSTLESEGTWVSDDENCDTKVRCDRKSSSSEGPDIGDFFEGLGDDITYRCKEEEEVSTYPSPEYFQQNYSQPIEAQSSDSETDFEYIFKSNLGTGKRYAFPRKDPRVIADAVEFWETDFEVAGSIYPQMSVWENKGLAPTVHEHATDFETFIMYKSLYDKWVKCNKSRDQWFQKYWGKSLETIAKSKEPTKRKEIMSNTPSLVCNVNIEATDETSSDCSVNQNVIAESRRRRRHNAMYDSDHRGSMG